MSHNAMQVRVVSRLAAVIVGSVLSLGSTAIAQKVTVPDAQVESNVLKALAGAPELANQQIQTTTVYGVVTLSGSVQTEAQRTQAENLAARAAGVQKVVDELTLGGTSAQAMPGAAQLNEAQGTNPNLNSDGTVAAPMAQGDPNSDNTGAPVQGSPNYGPGAPEYRAPYPGPYTPPQQQGANGYPAQPNPYPAQGNGYPPQGYGTRPQTQQPQYGAQAGGENVTIPSGALIRIRINETLDSGRNKVGDPFDGIVVNDVVAGGEVAIPRGASVHGTVTAATKSGVLAGRGDLSLQLTAVTLAGKTYPIVSDLWARHGDDKTTETVNNTAIGGGLGALFGAVAGGGTGAAIGAGIGGALGLGASAASGRGQVYVPAEGMLTFHLAQQAAVTTVSQQEMDRLGYGVPSAGGQQVLQRRPRPAYSPYYGPVYYRPAPYPYPYY